LILNALRYKYFKKLATMKIVKKEKILRDQEEEVTATQMGEYRALEPSNLGKKL